MQQQPVNSDEKRRHKKRKGNEVVSSSVLSLSRSCISDVKDKKSGVLPSTVSTKSISSSPRIRIKVEGQKIIAGADRKYKGLYHTYDEKILCLHLIHIIVVCSITTLS